MTDDADKLGIESKSPRLETGWVAASLIVKGDELHALTSDTALFVPLTDGEPHREQGPVAR
jgi:hypothetical protein